MKQICRNSLNGRCRFGSTCRYVHPTTTDLLDPPSWIYTSVEGLDTTEISSDELRYSLLVGDTRKILDDIWMDNYTKMYKRLNQICRTGIAVSPSARCVDIRKEPEVFNLPFDIPRIEKKILDLRGRERIVGEEDVMAGSDDESLLDQENVPGFIKEFQEKQSLPRQSDRFKGGKQNVPVTNNYNREPNVNSYNRESSYKRDDYNREPSYNRDSNRDSYNRDSYRVPNRDVNYRRDNYKGYPNEGRDSGRYQGHQDYKQPNKPYRPNDYNPSRPNDYNPSRPNDYNPSRPNDYRPRYPTNQPYDRGRKDQRPINPPRGQDTPQFYEPSQNDLRSPGKGKPLQGPKYPEQTDDSDFEYKNIPYSFDRK